MLAPSDGTVVEAADGVRDNLTRDTNPYSLTGNHIIIRHTDNEFSLLAHLRDGSIRVQEGDTVQSGQKIGECGNSGNSSSAHLHYQLQTSDVLSRFTEDYPESLVLKGR